MARQNINLYIPTFNCENQISKVLDSVYPYQELFNQILLIDNCSSDNTVITVKKKNLKKIKIIVNKKNLGFGGSHKIMFDHMLNENIKYGLILHGDNQADISNIIPHINNKTFLKFDALLGARFLHGSKLINYSFFRTLGNIFFNKMYGIVLKKKIYDLGSGINLYSKECIEDLNYRVFNNDLTFNYQNTIHIFKNKKKITFFKITWKDEGQISNVKIFNQTIIIIKILLKYVFFKKI